jgi:hypothetical protein
MEYAATWQQMPAETHYQALATVAATLSETDAKKECNAA